MAAKSSGKGLDEVAVETDRFEDTPHPRETTSLFGHAEAEKELLHSFLSGRLPQAFLIGGAAGIGKATLAWRLARFLLAHPAPPRPAEIWPADLFVPPDHPVARQIVTLAHPDLLLLRRAWNEKTKKPYAEIRVEDVRRAIHLFQQAPAQAGYRICIADSAEDLNASGANALLKLIEEPPPRSVFLIIAHRPGRVLATIRSRCRRVALSPLAADEVAQIVGSLGPPWSAVGAQVLNSAIALGHGSTHDVLRRLGGRGLEFDQQLRSLLDNLPRIDWGRVHFLADQVALVDGGSHYEAMLSAIFDWLDAKVIGFSGAEDGRPARRLAPYAEVWERVSEAARETEALNLDKRSLVLSIFADLASVARPSVL